jgi:hypothetical protein
MAMGCSRCAATQREDRRRQSRNRPSGLSGAAFAFGGRDVTQVFLQFSKWQAVVHVGGKAGIRPGSVVLGLTADDGEYRDFDPADAIVFVLEATDLQSNDGILIRVHSLHPVVMSKQRADGAPAGD